MAQQSPNGGTSSISDGLEKLNIRGGLNRMDSVHSNYDGLMSPSGSSPGHSQRGAGRSHRTEPFIIGVAGGTASGKTTVCDQIVQRLNGELMPNVGTPLRNLLRYYSLLITLVPLIHLQTSAWLCWHRTLSIVALLKRK